MFESEIVISKIAFGIMVHGWPYEKFQEIPPYINLSFTLLRITNDDQLFFFFLCFHMVFNNSLLFMSMSNLVLINMHFKDMKIHMLICFFISILANMEKEWGGYKMKVIIKT
jgi:hypothetical protein